MSRRLYSLLTRLLLPLFVLRLWWKGRKQPGYRQHIAERFGYYRIRPTWSLIWVHAVSVGETRAAQPLIRGLRRLYPDMAILVTHMTPTGRETAGQLFGDEVLSAYLPYDYPQAVCRFLEHFRPRIGIIMETEVWPNLTALCRQQQVPLLLANARLSARSARRYARFPDLSRQTFAALDAVAAQTAGDAQRLAALGAQSVQVVGNVKFDIEPPPAQLAKGAYLRSLIGERKVLLAASTREGEERLLLDAWQQSGPAGALLLIVPRHPERFQQVAEWVQARGLTLQRRSADVPVQAETQVLLGDSMGEMFAYYGACDVAYIGGSLLPLGGQNLIEACAVGRPILVGPHTFNFLEATEGAIAAGAARRVADAEEVITTAAAWFQDAALTQRMAQAGQAFAAMHRGASDRTLALIAGRLEAGQPL